MKNQFGDTAIEYEEEVSPGFGGVPVEQEDIAGFGGIPLDDEVEMGETGLAPDEVQPLPPVTIDEDLNVPGLEQKSNLPVMGANSISQPSQRDVLMNQIANPFEEEGREFKSYEKGENKLLQDQNLPKGEVKKKENLYPETPYNELIKTSAEKYKVPFHIAYKLFETESNFDPKAESLAGAKGIAQFMDTTAKDEGVDPWEPDSAIPGALKYLKKQYDKFGDWSHAVAAYNAGRGYVIKYKGIPPFKETQEHNRKIMEGYVEEEEGEKEPQDFSKVDSVFSRQKKENDKLKFTPTEQKLEQGEYKPNLIEKAMNLFTEKTGIEPKLGEAKLSSRAKAQSVIELLAKEEGVELKDFIEKPEYIGSAAKGLTDAVMLGIPSAIKETATGEKELQKGTLLDHAGQAFGSLAGLVMGPFSVAKGGVKAFRLVGRGTQEGKLAANIVKEMLHDGIVLGLGLGASQTGEALKEKTFTNAAGKIKKSIRDGAFTGMIFGASRGLFPKEGWQKGARLVIGLIGLNAQRAIESGGNPFTDRPIGEVIFDTALDAVFLYKGLPSEKFGKITKVTTDPKSSQKLVSETIKSGLKEAKKNINAYNKETKLEKEAKAEAIIKEIINPTDGRPKKGLNKFKEVKVDKEVEIKKKEKVDPVKKTVEVVKIKPLKDKSQQDFVDKKIEELGSLEAVEKFYPNADNVSNYAREKAAEIYGGEFKPVEKKVKPVYSKMDIVGDGVDKTGKLVPFGKKWIAERKMKTAAQKAGADVTAFKVFEKDGGWVFQRQISKWDAKKEFEEVERTAGLEDVYKKELKNRLKLEKDKNKQRTLQYKLKDIKQIDSNLKKFITSDESLERIIQFGDMKLSKKNVAKPVKNVAAFYRAAIEIDDGNVFYVDKGAHITALEKAFTELNIDSAKFNYGRITTTGGIGPDGHYYISNYIGDVPNKILGEGHKKFKELSGEMNSIIETPKKVEKLDTFKPTQLGKPGFKKGAVVPWKMEHYAKKAAEKKEGNWEVVGSKDKGWLIQERSNVDVVSEKKEGVKQEKKTPFTVEKEVLIKETKDPFTDTPITKLRIQKFPDRINKFSAVTGRTSKKSKIIDDKIVPPGKTTIKSEQHEVELPNYVLQGLSKSGEWLYLNGSNSLTEMEKSLDLIGGRKAKLTVVKNEPKKTTPTITLTSGLDPVQAVKEISKLVKDGKDFGVKLRSLGENFYTGKKQKYFDWQKKMKSALGNLWAKVKSKIQEVWKSLKKTVVKPLKNESGSVTLPTLGVRKTLKNAGKTADRGFGALSTRLGNIDPSIKNRMRAFELDSALKVEKATKSVLSYIKKQKKNMSKADYKAYDYARKNRDAGELNRLEEKHGLKEEAVKVRALLDVLFEQAKAVDYNGKKLNNYHPREVTDLNGLLEHEHKQDTYSVLEEIIERKEKKLKRKLSPEERIKVSNSLFRGYADERITLSKPGQLKLRSIQNITKERNKYYADSNSALLRYITDIITAVEAKKFFGSTKNKGINVDDTIGAYMLELTKKKKLTPQQARDVRAMLKARFDSKGTSGFMTTFKNLTLIDVMGSFQSAATQVGDIAWALYDSGIMESINATPRALIGKSEFTKEDLGISKIGAEFSDKSTSAKAVDSVFKAIGLTKIDAIGKEILINSAYNKAHKRSVKALREDTSNKFLNKRKFKARNKWRIELAKIFGKDVDKVIDDFANRKDTRNTRLYMLHKLSDFQPATLSELPEAFLMGGNWRILYMLKSFDIKKFDVYRREVFQQIAATNPKQISGPLSHEKVTKESGPRVYESKTKTRLKGIRNLIKLAMCMTAMEATADVIKDLMSGREVVISDLVIQNMADFFISRYRRRQMRRDGVASGFVRQIVPPFKFLDAIGNDLFTAGDKKGLQSVKSIPVAGRPYYDWVGKGANKRKEGDGRETRSSNAVRKAYRD